MAANQQFIPVQHAENIASHTIDVLQGLVSDAPFKVIPSVSAAPVEYPDKNNKGKFSEKTHQLFFKEALMKL